MLWNLSCVRSPSVTVLVNVCLVVLYHTCTIGGSAIYGISPQIFGVNINSSLRTNPGPSSNREVFFCLSLAFVNLLISFVFPITNDGSVSEG